MNILASDKDHTLGDMLEAFDCPAILVSIEYEILAFNAHYKNAFGEIDISKSPHCFAISHGYDAPCDQSGEECPLGAARNSGHKERVLHIHQTPRGKEHVDVEMLPIHDTSGDLAYFVELLRPVPLASGVVSDQELVGKSQSFNEMLRKLARVGATEASVLLLGESGTGKELAARAVHMASDRKDKPLVTLECAGLTDALFESELFGHIKGAFTGAHYNKKGLVEIADGGTLFLDELGDIPLSMQIKLLRLIESGTYRPVGSVEVRSSNFRLICATHKNLFQMVLDGQFRSDLYYRINVYPIHVPSLSERTGDIELLAKSLLKRLAPTKNYRLSNSAIKVLSSHTYIGNIRELRNLLNRAIVISDSETIDGKIAEQSILEDAPEKKLGPLDAENESRNWADLKTKETDYIRQVLSAYNGDKSAAADTLGISVRSLYRKLNS